MVLTFNRAWLLEARHEKLPRALTWALIVAIAVFFATELISSRYRSAPCTTPLLKTQCPADAKPSTVKLPVAP